MAVTVKGAPIGEPNKYAQHLTPEVHKAKAPEAFQTTQMLTKGKPSGPEQHTPIPVGEAVIHPAAALCEVYVEGGRTKNLGNFESARITVGIRMPCHKSEIPDVYQWATDWVAEKLTQAVEG